MSDASVLATAGSGQGRDAGDTERSRDILGVSVRVLSREQAVRRIEMQIAGKQHRKYAFLNAHGANLASRNVAFRRSLKNFEVLADGIGVDIGSKILYGSKFPDNLNGTDLIPALLGTIKRPLKVVLLGAHPGIAELAAENLSNAFRHHAFDVVHHGYFKEREELVILERLKQTPPDILLIALGNPVQEFWISKNCTAEHCTLAIGVGALFDFIAEHVPRAPELMVRTRTEWMYRLWLEPGRMWRRYVLGNPAFLLRILRQKIGLGRV